MTLPLALRGIGRRPVAWGAIVVTLGTALAITLALFAVLDGLLFRQLPFPDADRLVTVEYRPVGGRLAELAYLPERDEDRVSLGARLAGSPLVAGQAQTGITVPFDANAASTTGLFVRGVDAGFFPLLEFTPVLGRLFTADDEVVPQSQARAWPEPVPVILGYGLWQQHFGGDSNVLGVRDLAGRAVHIVGVMGPGVKFPGETNLWAAVRFATSLPDYVRLAPDATVEQLENRFPELQFRPLRDAVRPGTTGSAPLLFGAAVLLLLVAGLQVAAWLVAGAPEQLRDIGIRKALGASHLDLLRPWLEYSVLTAVAAAASAWVIGRPLTSAIIGLLPAELTHGQYLLPDARTAVFGAGLVLFGLGLLACVPLAIAGNTTPLALLQRRIHGRPLRIDRWRRSVLITQMAVTTVLLYLSGLAAHSVRQAITFDYGFDHERVVVLTPPRPGAAAPRPDQVDSGRWSENWRRQNAFKARLQESVERLQATAGVIAAASVFAGPLAIGNHNRSLVEVDLVGVPMSQSRLTARGNAVGPDFVRALGGTLLQGQSLDAPEYAGREDLMIVNETLARQLSPTLTAMDQNIQLAVLGRRIRSVDGEGEIIGVIKDLVDRRLDIEPEPQYFRIDRQSLAAAAILIRVSGRPDDAVPTLQQALVPIWGDLPPRHFARLHDALEPVLRPYREQAMLLGVIVACCLPLAGLGLAGALIASVRLRTREIAVRLALGATPGTVRALVARQAAATLAGGLTLGCALGVGAGQLLAHQFFGVRPLDPFTVLGVATTVALLGWFAMIVPARHATRINPIEALREG